MIETHAFGWSDLMSLCLNFSKLSLISVGGGMAVLPDMHRFIVLENRWLTPAQFSQSVALAQAAPGPNILFVALMGWYVSTMSLGIWGGLLAAVLSLFFILGPSSILTLHVSRWIECHQDARIIKSFHYGLAPIVIALLLSSSIFVYPVDSDRTKGLLTYLVCAVSFFLLMKTRVHLLLLLISGAATGAFGFL